MTITEACKLRIERLRRPTWGPRTYLKLALIDETRMGPVAELYDRACQKLIQEPTPQQIVVLDDQTRDYEEYTGDIDHAESNQ